MFRCSQSHRLQGARYSCLLKLQVLKYFIYNKTNQMHQFHKFILS
jgi:hypothetical protein